MEWQFDHLFNLSVEWAFISTKKEIKQLPSKILTDVKSMGKKKVKKRSDVEVIVFFPYTLTKGVRVKKDKIK